LLLVNSSPADGPPNPNAEAKKLYQREATGMVCSAIFYKWKLNTNLQTTIINKHASSQKGMFMVVLRTKILKGCYRNDGITE